MSERGEASVARHGGGMSERQLAAFVFFALALVGPICGLIYGKGPGLLDNLRAGAYSLPMAAFGIVLLFMPLRNPKDFFGGAMLVGMALFAFWASSDLPGMRGFAFGPGTAPRLFAWAMLIVGVGVALTGVFSDGPPEEPWAFSGPIGGAILVVALFPVTYYANRFRVAGVSPDIAVAAVGAIVVLGLAILLRRVVPRGPLFITAATLIFAITVRPLGLVFASFVSLMVSGYATHEIRWVEMTIWAVVLTIFCSLLFPWGLNLPLQLWPRF